MKFMKILPVLAMLWLTGISLPAKTYTLVSLNCYGFPEKTRDLVKFFAKRDLASGINHSIGARIPMIAKFIATLKPDIVCFQELWGEQNKRAMMQQLGNVYQYTYNKLLYHQMHITKLDDGLMVCTLRHAFKDEWLTFKISRDEDALAMKGFLIIALHNFQFDAVGNAKDHPLLVVDTHMQSGTNLADVEVKRDQVKQIAEELVNLRKSDSRLNAANLVLCGDWNEPITYLKNESRIYDRTRWILDLFNSFGFNLSNDQRLQELRREYKLDTIAEIHELDKVGRLQVAGGQRKPLTEHLDAIGQFRSSWGWDYWPASTDPDGKQILDHVFVEDNHLRLKNYRVFRKEILGGTGLDKLYDPAKAMSDHAAIAVELEPLPW